MEWYGIRGIPYDWFKSYLSSRSICTEFLGVISSVLHISCGVPQGSSLGPLLFLLYVNDIHTSSDSALFFSFADDTNLFLSNKDIKDLVEEANLELTKVNDWISANKLSLNLTKTKFIVFHPHQRTDYLPLVIKIEICGTVIKRVTELPLLGVTIDQHLSWKPHISVVSTKISKIIGILKHIRYFVPPNILLTIYNSLILPYLNYGLLVWGSCCPTNLNRLLTLQKRAIRFVSPGANYNSHHEMLCKANNILSLRDLYKAKCAKLLFDWYNDDLPYRILQLFSKVNEHHGVNTRSKDLFHIPRFRLILRSLNASISIARTWNSYPQDLIINPRTSPFTMKKNVKKYFINNYSEDCPLQNFSIICFVCNPPSTIISNYATINYSSLSVIEL